MKTAGWGALKVCVAVFATVIVAGITHNTALADQEEGDANSAAIALGRRLFYEGDLSLDGSMGCSTCHVQRHAFADRQVAHPGVTGEPGRRNVPSLANVAARQSLTWADPNLQTLEAHALIPLFGMDPVEMGMAGKEAELVRRLEGNACYRKLFLSAFPNEERPVSVKTVTQALAAFQRTIVSNDTAYDRFVRGEGGALTLGQKQGLALFQRDCASCHAGADLTDDKFHRVEKEPYKDDDGGLAAVTGRASDAGKFRTPSLRHVTLTGPYFHDGASATLATAIRRHSAVRLSEGEVQKIVEFLSSVEDSSSMQSASLSFPKGACEVAMH